MPAGRDQFRTDLRFFQTARRESKERLKIEEDKRLLWWKVLQHGRMKAIINGSWVSVNLTRFI